MTDQQDLNAKNQYQLIIVANEGGSVTQTGGVFEAGASVNVIAVPDEGYNFISWSKLQKLVWYSQKNLQINEFYFKK